MSPMGGQELLELLELREDASRFPVLVMTGDIALRERGIPGVLETVQKPNFDALLRLVDKYASVLPPLVPRGTHSGTTSKPTPRGADEMEPADGARKPDELAVLDGEVGGALGRGRVALGATPAAAAPTSESADPLTEPQRQRPWPQGQGKG